MPRPLPSARPGARGPRRTGSSSTSSTSSSTRCWRRGPTAAGLAGARPGLRRRPLPGRRRGRIDRRFGATRAATVRRWSASSSTPRPRPRPGARLGPEVTIAVGDALRMGHHGQLRRRRRQPAVPQPAGPRDHAPGPLGRTAAARTPTRPPSSWRWPSAWPGPTAGGSGSCCRSPCSRPAMRPTSAGEPAVSVASTGCGGRPATRCSTPRSTRWPPPSCSASASARCGAGAGEACHEPWPRPTAPASAARPTWSHLLADAAGIPVVEARDRRRARRPGHRHRRLPRPVLRPGPVRPRRAGRPRRSSRPA